MRKFHVKDPREPRLPFVALLNNIRSLYNVGSIFRTADAAGIEKLWLCGITGIPPSGKISKTALDAEQAVDWEFRADAAALAGELRARGYEIVLLEQADTSEPYHTYEPRGPVCLVAGNEISGVSESLRPLADRVLEIDMAGIKHSLNVSVAFGIAAYHIRRQLQERLALR